MPNIEWSEVAGEAMERDPREFPFGYLTGGSFVMDSVRVFVWFRTLDELLAHIRDIEPRVYDLEPGDGLEEYQARIDPLLAQVRKDGLSEPLREAVNAVTSAAFVVDWWGRYEQLRNGDDDLGRELTEEFRDPDTDDYASESEEEDAFIEYLRTCRV